MIGIARGLVTTFSHLVRPAITERYPYVKRELPPRSRSGFALTCDENGTPVCKVCLACQKDCPDGAISIESERPAEGGRRVLTRFSIDLGRCMYCGLCVESCPASALVHTGEFEQDTRRRGDTVRVLYAAEPREGESGAAREGDAGRRGEVSGE